MGVVRGFVLRVIELVTRTVVEQLLLRYGTTGLKIWILVRRQKTLEVERDCAYGRMAGLEEKERRIEEQKGRCQDATEQLRLDSNLEHVREDLASAEQLVTEQNRIHGALSENIHQLKLIQQHEQVRLPSTEELVRTAVLARRCVEKLQDDAALVRRLGKTIDIGPDDDEEVENILREFGHDPGAAPPGDPKRDSDDASPSNPKPG
jgi:hypothetical protein